ncbi:hypothetical protein [Brassicibacter mesophilus]|uniref:hypothetical protein n=1 Tax=Brassicibacter mesophilus TaxID=745119 RepID=UPI003D22B1A9
MKRFCSLLMVSLIIFLMVTPSYAIDPTYSTISPTDPELKASFIYLVGPYDENSNEGYEKVSDPSTGTYHIRVREIKFIHGPSDNDPVRNYRDFGTVYRTDNFSGSLSETVSISDSVTHSSTLTNSVAVSLGFSAGPPFAKVQSQITATQSQSITKSIGHTVTKTFSQGYNYGFPVNSTPENCTKAKRGVGFQYDTYRSIIDIKKEVDVVKYVDIVKKEILGDYIICDICGSGECSDPTRHLHHLVTTYRFTFADGTTVHTDSMEIQRLVELGIVTPDESKWKRSTKEWRREEIIGEVKVPVSVMVTVFLDKDGNILDENGNIIQ